MLAISWARLLIVWLSMAVAMSANGIIREAILKRAMSPTAADVASAILGVVIIALITAIGFRTIPPTTTTRSLIALSVILVLLTVAFECAIGILVDRKSWGELADHYAIWRGELWPIVLAFLAITPFLWSRWISRSPYSEPWI